MISDFIYKIFIILSIVWLGITRKLAQEVINQGRLGGNLGSAEIQVNLLFLGLIVLIVTSLFFCFWVSEQEQNIYKKISRIYAVEKPITVYSFGLLLLPWLLLIVYRLFRLLFANPFNVSVIGEAGEVWIRLMLLEVYVGLLLCPYVIAIVSIILYYYVKRGKVFLYLLKIPRYREQVFEKTKGKEFIVKYSGILDKISIVLFLLVMIKYLTHPDRTCLLFFILYSLYIMYNKYAFFSKFYTKNYRTVDLLLKFLSSPSFPNGFSSEDNEMIKKGLNVLLNNKTDYAKMSVLVLDGVKVKSCSLAQVLAYLGYKYNLSA